MEERKEEGKRAIQRGGGGEERGIEEKRNRGEKRGRVRGEKEE